MNFNIIFILFVQNAKTIFLKSKSLLTTTVHLHYYFIFIIIISCHLFEKRMSGEAVLTSISMIFGSQMNYKKSTH